jgi:hypothetical protein
MTSNLRRAVNASGWMYSARAVVFFWALLISHEFGISEYGRYAVAFAAGSLIGKPIDSYFTVRTPRVDDKIFAGERTTRVFIGLGLVLTGWLLWPFTFVGGFAVGKAGIDVCFQASRSPLIRRGHPDRAQRADAVRQIIGALLGAAYLLFYPGATLEVASLVYLAGCASPIFVGISHLVQHAPVGPEISRRSAVILAESVGGVAYVQMEVLLLGSLWSSTSAGYYSFGSTVLWSLASLGQSFAFTFHEGLRQARGRVSAGPSLRTALWLSVATAVVMGAIAIGLKEIGLQTDLWLVFAILAPTSFFRTLISVDTVVLMMQHKDTFRLLVTAVALVIKASLIFALARYGGPGAAISFLVADFFIALAYTHSVYGRAGSE